ncbi:MAG: bL17 family ribosomal protein [Planctomycetota bacterium]
MRHRRRGRKLGRNPNHQRALLRNLASSLILTERDPDDLRESFYQRFADHPEAKVKGRIVTTVSKAKEVRPLVEKCVTIAKKSLAASEAAAEYDTDAERGTEAWKSWRQSDRWQQWAQAMAPAVAARRRCVQLLGDKQAVSVLFEELAPRFLERPGGYTRVVRLATPRLGDNGTKAILEFVGERDRVIEKSEKPAFDAPDDDLPEDDELVEGADAEADEGQSTDDAEVAETSPAEGDDEAVGKKD